MRILFFLLLLAATAEAASTLRFPVDDSRVIPWSRNLQGLKDIPTNRPVWINTQDPNLITGGFPQFYMYASPLTNAGIALQACLNNCPTNMAIFIPGATFTISNALSIPHHRDGITVRGAGRGLTKLLFYTGGDNGAITCGNSDSPRPNATLAISAGATFWSSNITVSATTGLAVGKLMRMDAVDPPWVKGNYSGSASRSISSLYRVTAISGNDISFWPPLLYPLQTLDGPGVAPLSFVLERVGFEDLTLNLTNSGAGSAILFETSYNCWVRNVEITGSNGRQIWCLENLQNTFFGNYIHGTRSGGPNHEGLDLARECCYNLIENNRFQNAGFPAVILGDGSAGGNSGNVILNNWHDGDVDTATALVGAGYSVNHGPHNMYNLFEGNIGAKFQSDGFYGSASHNTLFRNFFSGNHATLNELRVALDLGRDSLDFNIVACILGTPGLNTSFLVNTVYDATLFPVVRGGYPGMGHTGFTDVRPPSASYDALHADVTNTWFYIANYDYWHNALMFSTNPIPESYFDTEKPAYAGNLTWPWIDPTSTPPRTNMNPAQAEAAGLTFPYGEAQVAISGAVGPMSPPRIRSRGGFGR